MILFTAFVTLLTLFSRSAAMELDPWFGKTAEIEWKSGSELAAYHSVNCGYRSRRHPGIDLFFTSSAGISLFDYAAEIEATTSKAHHYYFGFDSIQLTGRYRLFNDILDDPYSIMCGLTIRQVFKPGLRNLSSFHHGGIECEAHAALGKEHSCLQFWTSRCWAVLSIGVADLGYPWIKADLNWEKNFWDLHRLHLFACTLWGLGHHHLHPNHFHGYGAIRHHSIDLGMGYSYLFEWGGTLNLEYGFRVFARNSPQNASLLSVNFLYPFGL